MENYLKNYSRKKIIEFTVTILTLCLITVYVRQLGSKTTICAAEKNNRKTFFIDTIVYKEVIYDTTYYKSTIYDTIETDFHLVKNKYEQTISSLYLQNADLTKLLNECERNSIKSFIKGRYYYYELTGNSDSIDLRKLDIDLLILKNVGIDTTLYLDIIQPNHLFMKDIAYESLTYQDDLFWSNGKWLKGKYMIISVEKLNRLNDNIIIEFTKPSLIDIPPLGRLKLFTN